MKFNPAKNPPEKTGEGNLCLVWVYDTDGKIGYCWPQLCYLDEWGVWMPDELSGDARPLETDDMKVTAWAYVPKPRRARFPTA